MKDLEPIFGYVVLIFLVFFVVAGVVLYKSLV
ncbi:hypothetical protein Milano_080 [Agrobacterium phage Milano]|nr:hypothetical protein Milano_080 [Agrobacterium phage Milano]